MNGSEEGPLIDLVLAGAQSGSGEIDVIGALHGTYPPLAREDAMMNMIDVADDLLADRDLAPAFLETGLLGSDDFLYYVPWMQATYIMGANVEALDYLPDGADVNALTWEQFGEWCQNILDETGEPKVWLAASPDFSTVSWKAICGPPSPVVWFRSSTARKQQR